MSLEGGRYTASYSDGGTATVREVWTPEADVEGLVQDWLHPTVRDAAGEPVARIEEQ